ncbi:MAG: helix-hairpin-helix domain-containing protein [bacterium]|nr:helix-hairpin-helix domain-containing protein [bacterium]
MNIEIQNPHCKIQRKTGENGASLLLVLAILTVLAIIGSSFVYFMRTELVAASNFADRYKADYIAETGINNARLALISSLTTERGELAPYGTEPSSSSTAQFLTRMVSPGAKVRTVGLSLEQVTTVTNPKVNVVDEESKLNLLVACDTEKYSNHGGLDLKRFLNYRLDRAGFINASYLAETVAQKLYTAYYANQITSLDIVKTLVGDSVYNALADYLTIYSATPNVDKYNQKRADINSATAAQLYSKLTIALNPARAAQLAVNIVDFRDADSIPTLLTVQGTTYRGIEQMPYINEIMAYSLTPDEYGNDGQYIELYNPYHEEIVLDGWRIEGTFGSIDLFGTIPSRGYFIITDEYQDDAEYDGGTPDGYCFINNYGSVPNSQLVVNEHLSLSKTGDILRLYDANGNLIDEVRYSNAEKNISWEKNDPRIPDLFPKSGGTAFAQNQAYAPPFGAADESALAYISNLPFGGIGDLGYVGIPEPSIPWVTVSIDSESNGIRFADIIDFLSVNSESRLLGQVNINTAPVEVLMALPGMTAALAEEIVSHRTITGRFNLITDLTAIPGFCGRDNFDDDNDGIVDDENEKQIWFRQLADWITVRSNVFSIRSSGTAMKGTVPISTSSLLVVVDRSVQSGKILFRKRI